MRETNKKFLNTNVKQKAESILRKFISDFQSSQHLRETINAKMCLLVWAVHLSKNDINLVT